jgi:dTDP-4-dehydro-6-deoxy-alpha-D-glucopyranose 2,3-dehydratase
MLNPQLAFLKSAFQSEGAFVQTPDVIAWLKEQNAKVNVKISKSTFSKLNTWIYKNGSLQHESGKFFSIDGIQVKTNWGQLNTWHQPIINQPEIGYLGFITKEFGGVLHFLMQAKIEPGNMNYVQLSPTLQATKSNYTQVHKGKAPAYLNYFKNAKPDQILVDQLQSEQGARFLRKRNRNIIIVLKEELPIYDNFIWLTLAQIKELMNFDNLVNMDTRTVISGISFGTLSEDLNSTDSFVKKLQLNSIQHKFLNSALISKKAFHSLDNIIAFLTNHKSNFDLSVEQVDIKKLSQWIFTDEGIIHEEKKYFQVIPIEVEISNREVYSWCQPMVQPMQEGLCAFVCKEIDGILHFAVQAKLECGNHDIIEFAPTVQCLTGNYRSTSKGCLPFLDYVLEAPKENIVFDTLQSEEGGRFYREQNRNMLVVADETLSNNLPENYIWMTLNQMFTFLKFNNFFNIQARSLIAAIQFV